MGRKKETETDESKAINHGRFKSVGGKKGNETDITKSIEHTGKINALCVAVYELPCNANIVGTLSYNDVVIILEYNDGYCKIKLNDIMGYVPKYYINF